MTASSWLPQYLTRVQPYSMGPLLGYEWPDMLMPPAGTCVWLDNVALSAAAMWMAPAPVRREARRLGLPVPRLRVPGLAEALERAGVKTWQGPKGEVVMSGKGQDSSRTDGDASKPRRTDLDQPDPGGSRDSATDR